MKILSSLTILMILLFAMSNSFAQTSKVGINTNMPLTGLHVQDSGVLFNHGFYLLENLPAIDLAMPPVSGAGARLMWFPYRKAFRVGQVDGTEWDRDNTGNMSFATGLNNTAYGRISSVFGRNNRAYADVCFVAGQYNDPIVSKGSNTATAPSLLPTAPLFIVGNGDELGFSNAMLIRKDGKVGIGTNSPTDRFHINTAATEDAFRVQVNSSTKMRVWNNGGTSLGSASLPPANGLLVNGPVQPQNGISTAAKMIIESTADSIILNAGGSQIIIAANGNITIRSAASAKIDIQAGSNLNLSGTNISIAATASLNLNGAIIRLNGGNTPVAKFGSISTVSGPIATVSGNVSNTVFTP